MNNNDKSLIYGGLAVLFWSTIATAFKVALSELTPGQLLFIASITSVIILFIITLFERSTSELFDFSLKSLANSAILALVNPFIYYLLLLKAYELLPAQVAQPLNMIWPIILVFLSVPLLKKSVDRRSALALIISFLGVYIVSSQGSPFSTGGANLKGVLLATGSSLFWALYFIFNLRDKRRESIKLLTNFIFASIYMAVFLLVTDGFGPLSNKGILSGIYVGVFEMGLAFYLWLKALNLASSPARVTNLVYLAPFISLIFITIILHEKIYITTPFGLILIIGGIIYQNTGKKIKTNS
jgi:drug/metabolite transporter (DMT)-like permease